MTPHEPTPLPDPGAASAPPGGWEALARHLAGECSPAEAERLEAWLRSNPADATLLESLDRSLDRLAVGSSTPVDVEGALRSVRARLDDATVIPLRPAGRGTAAPRQGAPMRWSDWRTPALRAAAITVVVASVAFAWRAVGNDRAGAPQVAVAAEVRATGAGERESVRLLDGTLAVLGPGSRLEIAAGYGGERRDVTLEGDGWFEVAHDDARPFTVHAGGAAVRDIGTAFAVRAREGSPVRVVVTQGAVLLRAADRPETEGVVLHEQDVGTLDLGGRPVAERGAATEADVAWRSGRLVFRAASLDEVRDALRRWYGLELVVADPALEGRRFTGEFAGEGADQVLRVLSMALGAEFERRGDTITVRARGGSGSR